MGQPIMHLSPHSPASESPSSVEGRIHRNPWRPLKFLPGFPWVSEVDLLLKELWFEKSSS